MNNFDKHKSRAERIARRDYKNGKACDAGRYHARKGCAWHKWYTEAYAEIASNFVKKGE